MVVFSSIFFFFTRACLRARIHEVIYCYKGRARARSSLYLLFYVFLRGAAKKEKKNFLSRNSARSRAIGRVKPVGIDNNNNNNKHTLRSRITQ